MIKYPDTARGGGGGGGGEGGREGGGGDEKFVNGIHLIRYSLYAVTLPGAQPIAWPLEVSNTPKPNQWLII